MIISCDLGPVPPEGEVDNRQPRRLTRAETAACLLAILCRQGAVFTIDAHGFLRSDVNPLTFPQGDCNPGDLAHIVLSLAVEIKAILRAEQTKH